MSGVFSSPRAAIAARRAAEGANATLLANGDVLMAGGRSGSTSFTDRTEVYDATANNWEATGVLSFSRAAQQGISLTNGARHQEVTIFNLEA